MLLLLLFFVVFASVVVVVFVLLAFHDVGVFSCDKLGGRVTQYLSPDDDDQEDFAVAFYL